MHKSVLYKCNSREDSTYGSWYIGQKVASLVQIGQGLQSKGFYNFRTISHKNMRFVTFNKAQKAEKKVFKFLDDSINGFCVISHKVTSARPTWVMTTNEGLL